MSAFGQATAVCLLLDFWHKSSSKVNPDRDEGGLVKGRGRDVLIGKC
jgi:hypothetical protein